MKGLVLRDIEKRTRMLLRLAMLACLLIRKKPDCVCHIMYKNKNEIVHERIGNVKPGSIED